MHGTPGSGDVALMDLGNYTYTGNGTVGFLDVVGIPGNGATFTGSITADEIGGGDITAQGATLTASDEFLITSGNTLVANSNATIDGPSSKSTSGPFGNAGFEDFGTVQLQDNSQLNAYKVDVFGTMTITSGAVKATDLIAGTTDGESQLSIGGSGMITELVRGPGPDRRRPTVTLDDGTWTSGTMIAGAAGDVTFTLQNDANLNVTGPGGALFPEQPAFALGSQTAGDSATMTIDGSEVDVTGDAWIAPISTATLDFGANGNMTVSGTFDVNAGAFSASSGVADVEVTGGVAFLQVGGDALVGELGTGSVEVDASNTFTIAGLLDVGTAAGGVGSITVGGTFSVGGNATIGDAGTGVLAVSGGASVTVGGTLVVGAQSGGQGTLTVADVPLSVTGDVTLGAAGAASVTLGTDGSLEIGAALDAAASADSTATLAANGGIFDVASDAKIGDDGTATVSLRRLRHADDERLARHRRLAPTATAPSRCRARPSSAPTARSRWATPGPGRSMSARAAPSSPSAR